MTTKIDIKKLKLLNQWCQTIDWHKFFSGGSGVGRYVPHSSKSKKKKEERRKKESRGMNQAGVEWSGEKWNGEDGEEWRKK